MRRILAVIALMMLAVGVEARAPSAKASVGSVTLTYSPYSDNDSRLWDMAEIGKITIVCVSNGSGAVTAAVDLGSSGFLHRIAYVPGVGDATPTDDCDFTFTETTDLLQGTGANLDTTNSKHTTPVDGTFAVIPFTAGATLSGTGMGDSNQYTITLWIERKNRNF